MFRACKNETLMTLNIIDKMLFMSQREFTEQFINPRELKTRLEAVLQLIPKPFQTLWTRHANGDYESLWIIQAPSMCIHIIFQRANRQSYPRLHPVMHETLHENPKRWLHFHSHSSIPIALYSQCIFVSQEAQLKQQKNKIINIKHKCTQDIKKLSKLTLRK